MAAAKACGKASPKWRRLRRLPEELSAHELTSCPLHDIGHFPPLQGKTPPAASAVMDEALPLQRASLHNLGNTCWMNALTQAVLHLPELVASFRDHQLTEACHAPCTMCTWQAAEAATRTSAAQPVALPMWEPVARRFGFDFHSQQDAAEVLTLVFSDIGSDPRLCTALQTHMYVSLRRQPRCNCIVPYEHAAPAEQSFMLPMSMTTHAASDCSEMLSVAGLLEANSKWQGTDEDNSCKCPHCFTPIPSFRRFDIVNAGTILCLEIKRFVNVVTPDGFNRMKRLPTSLKLSPVLNIAGHVYALSSMVLHAGATPRSGHYTAIVSVGSSWQEYDDGSVRNHTNIPESAEKNAVILFYCRLPESADPTPMSVDSECLASDSEFQESGDQKAGGCEETASAAHAAPVPSEGLVPFGISDDDRTENALAAGSAACSRSTIAARAPKPPCIGDMASAEQMSKASVSYDEKSANPQLAAGSVARSISTMEARPPKPPCIGNMESAQQMSQASGSFDQKSANPHPSGIPATEKFMEAESTFHRLRQDVTTLLNLWKSSGRSARVCHEFLATLPMFAEAPSLEALSTEFNVAVGMLAFDRVNSAAALNVRIDTSETMCYQVAVLLHATAIAECIPPVFLIDAFHTTTSALLHKTLSVRLNRYKSKSRHWWVGTANVGEGKSPGMRPFINIAIEVLTECRERAEGMEHDRWHFQQGSTTAAAIDKLRLCNGYLCIYCSDAARILDMNAATGGHTNQLAKVDLDIFLDAAHGDEFSHATMKAREKALARPVRHPQEQVQPPQGLHIEDTNVHIMFLQQDCIFTDYWAQMASRKAVGLAQRCLFSFGGDMDPAPVDLSTFKAPTVLLFLIYLFCFLLVIPVLLPS